MTAPIGDPGEPRPVWVYLGSTCDDCGARTGPDAVDHGGLCPDCWERDQ